MKRLGTGIGWQKRKRIRVHTTCLLLLIAILITAGTIPVSAKKAMLGTTVVNQCLYGSGACEHDGKIYFVGGQSLFSVEKDGTNLTRLYTSKRHGFKNLTVLGDCIYALEIPGGLAPYGRLVRMKMDGTGYKVYKGKKFDELEFLCAVDNRLYYEKDHCIYMMKPDGTGKKLLVQNEGCVYLMDGKYIYYKPNMAYGLGTVDQIIRCDMNGKKAKTVLSSKDYIYDFFVHEGDYYYSTQKEGVGTVYKKNIKSGSVKKLFSETDKDRHLPLGDLHAAGKYLYYVNKKGHLEKVDKSTGKSKAFKGNISSIDGAFDDVILAEKPKNKKPDGHRIMILVDRRTGKELAELIELISVGAGA